MKQKFRFIGARSEMRPGPTLTRLGETFEADPSDVLTDGGIPAIPTEDFEEIFAAVEPDVLARHAQAEARTNPPQELADALQRAAIRLHELRGGKV